MGEDGIASGVFVMISSMRHYRHVVEEIDRHGNVRHYFRAGHGLRIRMRETPGTEGYDKHYHELMRRWAAGELKAAPRDGIKPGTFRWRLSSTCCRPNAGTLIHGRNTFGG